MSESSRALSFSIYEDEDCRTGPMPSFPSLVADEPDAGQTGLTTHMPPPPLPSPFTVRVPSGGSSSSSSAASSVIGLAGRTAHFPPPFKVTVPSASSSSSSSAASSVVGLAGQTAHFPPPFKVTVPSTSSSSSASSDSGPAGRVGLRTAPRSTPWGPARTPVAHHYGEGRPFVVKVPSAGSSSSGYLLGGCSTTSRSSSGYLSGGSSTTSGSSIVTVTTTPASSSTSTSSSTASFYSCLSSPPSLIGSGQSGTGSSCPLPYQTVPGFNCMTYNSLPSPQQQNPILERTTRLGRYRKPHEARKNGSPDELDGIKDWAEKQAPRRFQPRLRTPRRDNRARKILRRNVFTFGKLERSGPLDGIEGPGGGAHEQKQLHTPTETPEHQRFVDALVKDWMRTSVEQDDVASTMHADGMDGDATQQLTPIPTKLPPEQDPEQLLTPADTPEPRGFRDVSAGALACTLPPGDDVATAATSEQAGHGMAECLGRLEGLKLVGDDDDDDDDGDALKAAQRLPPTPASGSPGSRPRGPLGRRRAGAATGTPRRGCPRVQKSGRGRRRRRRTEAELTMHHAIRWSGMGGVVPNVSVVTRGPLVQMPLPCTFGEGPSRKAEGEGEEDFAVGLSRGVVREVQKRRAERVRRMGRGA